MVLSEPGSQPFVMVAAPAAQGATEAALRDAATEVMQADITPYRGVKMETQLLEQEPAARAAWSPKRTMRRSGRRRSRTPTACVSC